MELMRNRIRPYAWGSRTAIAELLGEPSPAPHPQAELWLGAHPGDPSELVEHVGPDVLGDETVLGPQEGQAAGDPGQVGQGDRAHAAGELAEDATVELPLPSVPDLLHGSSGDVVEHVVEIVVLGWDGAEAGQRVVDGGVGPGLAERLLELEGPDLRIGFGDR